MKILNPKTDVPPNKKSRSETGRFIRVMEFSKETGEALYVNNLVIIIIAVVITVCCGADCVGSLLHTTTFTPACDC